MLEKARKLVLSEPNLTPAQLASIKPPTMLLDGETEELLAYGKPKEIANQMPQAKFVLMPNVGNNAMDRKPAEFNKIVLDFLRDK